MFHARTVNDPIAIFSASVISAVGAAIFLTLPMLVGTAIGSFSINEQTAGLLVASYFSGALVANISQVYWLRHANWRYSTIALFCLMGIGMVVLPLLWPTYAGAVVGLFLAGFSIGAAYGIAVAVLSDGKNKDRNFGFMLIGQQVGGALLLFLFPQFVPEGAGFDTVMVNMGIIFLTIGLVGFCLPDSGRKHIPQVTKEQQISLSFAFVSLLMLVTYFAAQTAVWAFIERLADERGIDVQDIGTALAISMIGGLLGGIFVAWQAERFGSLRPILLSSVSFVLIFLLYATTFTLTEFTILSFMFSFFWNYVLAYQMSVVVSFDHVGRLSVLLPAAMALGAMIGPTIGGAVLQTGNFQDLAWLTSLIIVGCSIVYIYLLKRLPSKQNTFV